MKILNLHNLNKRIITIIIILLSNLNSFSQVEIDLEEENGVYKIPCKVNSIPFKFIIDTGASNVTISLIEAKFLFKQGLLDKTEIISSENYEIANGDIIEGTKIILKKIEIGEIIIENTEATVVHTQNAPLLLGMSVLKKLGKFSIEKNKLIIHNSDSSKHINSEVQDTVNWINNKFEEHKDSWWGVFRIESIKQIENEPFLFISMRNFCSGVGNILIKIPINKIQPITFLGPSSQNNYHLIFKMKNDKEFTWYQTENCGEIGNETFIVLDKSIENENIINRLKVAFDYLISLHTKNIKEKF